MTRGKKIKRVAELRASLHQYFLDGNWDEYNKAVDEMGTLNRSMMSQHRAYTAKGAWAE